MVWPRGYTGEFKLDVDDALEHLFEEDPLISAKPTRIKKGLFIMTPTTPLKANQVRAYINKKKETQYYIVVNKEIDVSKDPEWGALWFRMQENAPMHLSFGFKVSEDHEIVMENINIIRDTLEKINHGEE